MTYDAMNTERIGTAYVVTFNRPERRNAISKQLVDELAADVGEAEADPAVRGIVITGANNYFERSPMANAIVKKSFNAETENMRGYRAARHLDRSTLLLVLRSERTQGRHARKAQA